MGRKGGVACAAAMTPERRAEVARKMLATCGRGLLGFLLLLIVLYFLFGNGLNRGF